jgi:ABC-type sugar transport system permease subunit
MATPTITRPEMAAAAQVRSARRWLRRDAAFGYALLFPAAALITLLVGYPFIRALWLSFHRKLLGRVDAPWICFKIASSGWR